MNEHNRGFRSLKNARFNAWIYGLNAYNEAYPEYAYNYPFYGYGYPYVYPIAEWLSYQHYYPTYYPNYYQYYYMANNYNNLAKKYNELQLDENKYLNNELEQPSPNLPIKIADIQKTPIQDYSEAIPPIEKEDTHNISREITLEQLEVTPVEDTAYNTYHTVETYYTVDTYDIIPYSE